MTRTKTRAETKIKTYRVMKTYLLAIFIFFAVINPVSADFEWPDSISGVEYNLADVGYLVNKSDSSRNRLILAAEQLINRHCIKEISPLRGRLNEDGFKKCDEIIEKLTTLDPDNPILICLKNGYSSHICASSFGAIKLQSFNTYTNIDDKDVEAALASKTEDPQKDSEDIKLTSLRQRLYNDPKKSEVKEEIISILLSRVKRHCGVIRYHVAAPDIQPTTAPTAKPQKTQRPFQDMLDQLSQKSTPTPAALGSSRIRLVSPQCFATINDLKKYSSENIAVVCVERGYFSPQCLMKQKSQPVAKNSGPQNNSGFEPF